MIVGRGIAEASGSQNGACGCLQVVRYLPGQFYRTHHDSSSNISILSALGKPLRGRRLQLTPIKDKIGKLKAHVKGSTHSVSQQHSKNDVLSSRLMTAFLYLNEVEGGGATRFPLIRMGERGGNREAERLQFNPQKGMLVLWPNIRNNKPTFAHFAMMHEAMNVTRGIKFGGNFWIH